MKEKKNNGKNIKFRVNNAIVVAMVLTAVILMNIILSLAEDRFPKLKVDLTHDALTKVTDETRAFLKGLEEGDSEIDIIYLKGTKDVTKETDTVLKQYDAYCENIDYCVENFHTNPLILEPFGIDSGKVTEGTVVVTNKDRTRYRAISPSEMWSGSEFLLESKVTNAAAYVTNDESINVCVAVGYESDANYLDMIQAMIDDNVTVSRINLADDNAYVPSMVDVLMLLVPYRDLDVKEIYKIDDYIQRGGSVVVALPFGTQLENLESYIESWGVKVNNDVVYEMNSDASYGDTGVMFYPQKDSESFACDISQNIVASYVRSMSFTKTGDIECTRLLHTTKDSVATPPVDANKVTSEDIVYGPFDIAYLLEKPVGDSWDKTGKLIVTTTPSVWGVEGMSGVLNESRFGNRAFLTNSIKELSDKSVASVLVPKKTATENIMDISDAKAAILKVLICILLPIVVLILGAIVWLKRRNK